MKKILILGANGATAREIIPRLLEQEDVRLTLFLRRAARKQGFKSKRVEIVEGDANSPEDLMCVVQGHEMW